MKRIICLSSVDYNWMFQRPQQLMKEFSNRGWEVIYCNKKQRKELFLEKITDNLTICHNIEGLIESRATTDLLWVVDPSCVNLKGIFNERLMVYDCVDDFPFLKLKQHKMMKAADIIITTSKPLFLDLKKYKKDVYLIQNGCDISFFDNHKNLPIDWQPPIAEGRVIGYIGALAFWVDTNILADIAVKFPKENILLVGANISLNNLPQLKNISFVGHQSYDRIPAYLERMDVALIPFKQNQITRATNPIKMYEYLSLGKPVVSSLIPEVVPYKEFIYISKDKEEFINNINIALNETDTSLKEGRRGIAINNSWKSRVNEIEAILKQYKK